MSKPGTYTRDFSAYDALDMPKHRMEDYVGKRVLWTDYEGEQHVGLFELPGQNQSHLYGRVRFDDGKWARLDDVVTFLQDEVKSEDVVPASRSYVVGLPVVVTVSPSGRVTYEVGLEEADAAIREGYLAQDLTDEEEDAVYADADKVEAFYKSTTRVKRED